MAISDLVTSISNTNWFLTDNFEVVINNNKVSTKEFDNFANDIRKSTMSVTLPELTANENDQVIGGERRIGVQLFEAFRFSVKFRDYDGGKLRQFFETIWVMQQYEYFDDIKTNVTISTNASSSQNATILFSSEDCLITGISGYSLDNSATAIAEFDVSFYTNKFSDDLVSGFGTEKVSSIFNQEVVGT